MTTEIANIRDTDQAKHDGSILLGTSLALVSMILIPAFATRIGLGASLTGALRMAMMKASHQALRGS